MTERDRPGTYNPFEDTGDWPFRESAPPPVQRSEPGAPFDREQHELEPEGEHEAELEHDPEDEPELEPETHSEPPFRLDERLPEAVAELEPEPDPEPEVEEPEPEAVLPAQVEAGEEETPAPAPEPEPEPEREPKPDAEAEPGELLPPAAEAARPLDEHAPGDLRIPEGPEVLEGGPNGFRRTVAIVVSRFNADVTDRLLESAIDALTDAHVTKESITVVPVPGAFELPLAAMALAKTRRFSCIVALGCVIRGETAHFDFVAGEAASGLQLAAIETGVPVSFGLLTLETKDQAETRIGKGADAARAALEMADLFTQVRTRAARTG
jgi:6,7-dimethyl-8-ribityllumazine synthase